jgi:hypothetical protein
MLGILAYLGRANDDPDTGRPIIQRTHVAQHEGVNCLGSPSFSCFGTPKASDLYAMWLASRGDCELLLFSPDREKENMPYSSHFFISLFPFIIQYSNNNRDM